MTRKIERVEAVPSGGRAAVKSHEIVSAIREGRLTRGQFDAWHTQRRSAGRGIVITLREKAPGSSKAARHAARKHKSR